MKKILSVFLALICCFSFVLPAFAAESGAFTVLISEADDAYVTLWTGKLGTDYLFLPTGTPESVRVRFSGKATLDGKALTSGGAAGLTSGTHSLIRNGVPRLLVVMRSENIPALFISTESGSMDALNADKSHKESGSITVFEEGKVTLSGSALKSVKGRGNSTWTYDKKPYNIKFDKKTSLLGMPKAKKWTLLANYLDMTAAKNKTAMDLGLALGNEFTSESVCADIYFNGEYYGNYTVCESVEVGENRVEITNLADLNEKANPDVPDIEALPAGGVGGNQAPGTMHWTEIPKDPEDISGGYLLELEFPFRFDGDPSGFVSPLGQCVVVKEPEYASEAQVRYISAFYSEIEEAVYSPTGYNSLGKYYTEYFDMPSLLRTFLLYDLVKDKDAGESSCFFYKEAGSDLLFAGPLWDFDRTFGRDEERYEINIKDPAGWDVGMIKNTFFTALFRHEDFRDALERTWSETILADKDAVKTLFADIYEQNRASIAMNQMRWENHVSAAAALAATDREKEKTLSFIDTRLTLLNRAYEEAPAVLFYDMNGSPTYVFERNMFHIGDSVKLCNPGAVGVALIPPEGLSFCGWNEAPDGSGRMYLPGERLELREKTTVLYAIWGEGAGVIGEICPYDSQVHTGIFGGLIYLFHRIFYFFETLFG